MLVKALAAAAGNFGGGYNIEDSLRFNDNDSAYLSRTPATAGNRKTWTWSGWVKRGNVGEQGIFYAQTSGAGAGNSASVLLFTSSHTLLFVTSDGSGGTVTTMETQAVFRDSSGWYHIVLYIDSTQAGAADAQRLYVNGVLQSLSTNTHVLNTDHFVNSVNPHYIGLWSRTAGTFYFDGYMAEINFIDGQALTPDSFGEINATTGEWSPKAYSGTYGTNGFYLPFDGNANDDSGNGNNWTENNLASTDYMIDTPTNNFSVFNFLSEPVVGTLQEGNLESNNTAANWAIRRATIAPTTGKWYCEFYLISASDDIEFGVVDVSVPSTTGRPASGQTSLYALRGSNLDRLYLDAVEQPNLSPPDYADTGNIISMAYDIDAGTVNFYVNNTLRASTTMSNFEPVVQLSLYNTQSAVINFGQDSSFAGNKTRQGNTDANGIGDFYYEPPAGYLALCTENLPAPAIEQPETHFNVVLDTGANIKATAEALYDSSLIWIKDRANSNNHQLIDTVRGTGVLQSNTDAAETTYSAPSGNSVAWVWKAGGTAVSNTDGSITSQVSANVDAGFSIVSYTGVGYPNATTAEVGHGLDLEPELVIIKKRGGAGFGGGGAWVVGAGILPSNNWVGSLYLNSTGEYYTAINYFWNGSPTSSVIKLKNDWFVNGLNNTYIAYCFHSVESFSKIGVYVGNGSTNGPFVYTGFKPAFVMVKRTDSTSNWTIIDNEREGYNVDNDPLYPNLSNAEGTADLFDILSNGFKCRSTDASINASGGTYIYMAFAEHPFQFSTGR